MTQEFAEMARTLATLPTGARITDYISLGMLATTFPRARIEAVLAASGGAIAPVTPGVAQRVIHERAEQDPIMLVGQPPARWPRRAGHRADNRLGVKSPRLEPGMLGKVATGAHQVDAVEGDAAILRNLIAIAGLAQP